MKLLQLSLLSAMIGWANAAELFAQTDVYLKVYAKTFNRLALDLHPFEAESETDDAPAINELITNVLSNDLWMSGYFQVNVKGSTPEDSSHSSDSNNHSTALARISGTYRFQGNQITVRPLLIDVASGKAILRQKYTDLSDNKRELLHRISDDLVFQLTGDRGIADSKIAFINQKSDGTKEISTMDYDGHNVQAVTSDRSIAVSPAWSPEARKICYTSYKNGEPHVFVLDLKSKQTAQVSNFKGLNTAPAWSPGGRKIALTLSKDGNAEIYLLEIERGRFRRLTFSGAIDSSPTWSPSTRDIAFTSDRSGSPQIYVMDSDGLNLRRLTFEGKYNDSPAWSPRGDKIAFVSRTESGFDIYTIDVDGQNLMRLTDSSGSNEDPSWSPNGFALIFSSTRTGKRELYSMFWDGSDQKKITSTGINYSPSWSPRIN